MSSAIDIVVVNDVDYTQVQEVGSVIQQEVRATTNNGDDSTIDDLFVGTIMGQYIILQSTITRHSPPSCTEDLYNKY